MKSTLYKLFFSLSLLFQIPGFASAVCIIPSTDTTCHELVSELPWLFNIHVKEEQPIRITYLSSHSMQQPNMYLKIFLDISEYPNRQETAIGFSQTCQKADPDMGLSYGWDLLLIRKNRIYHLHADCTLAEQHFNSLAQSLQQIIGPPDTQNSQTLSCRCGGGCKQSQ